MKHCLTATFAGLALLGWQGFAYAQLAVSDAVTETNTLDMDTVQEPGILAQDTLTAQSVTTGGGAGLYTPVNGIGAQDQQLFSAATDFANDFPGWQPLSPTSTIDAMRIVNDLLSTYAGALGVAQSQANELANEDSSAIENANAGATAILQAVQINTEAVLALKDQLKMLNQSLLALVTVEATHHVAEIDIVAQVQAGRVRDMLLDPSNQPQVANAPRLAAQHNPR